MNIESDLSDNDDSILITNFISTSTDDSDREVRKTCAAIRENKGSAPTSDFDEYLETYERIYTLFCRGEHEQWKTIFKKSIEESPTPYQLLYLFLDHSSNTTNNRKHKMITPFIKEFKLVDNLNKTIVLDETIKRNIILKICSQCASSQLESIVDIFNLRATENQQFIINLINEQIEQKHDMVFISHITKIFKLLELNAISFEKIIIPLILKSQWETVKFVVGNDKILQKKLLKTIDELISSDKSVVRQYLTQYSIEKCSIDNHSLQRLSRKLLKQYHFDISDFPNLIFQEKLSFLKTLFVRKYLEKRNDTDDTDDQSWDEQIKELISDNHDLKIQLIDLFIDYIDIDAAVKWSQFYNLEDSEIPQQVKIRREDIIKGHATSQPVLTKPSSWLKKQNEDEIYKPTIFLSDIVYIEVDTDVDPFLERLECSRCDVGSHLPFVGFDCETFMDPTQRMLNSQIISIIQLASFIPTRNQITYGIFDMLALRLQFDMKALAEFAQRIFCSKDFILLAYNYAGDTSSLIENYPSMSDALMQGTAVIDLFHVHRYIIEHHPEIFPYYGVSTNGTSRGLSELVRLCFGKPLDKTMQTSDWRKRPLKQSQLIYSVLDARVLVDIALLIEERTRTLNITWSWSDFKGYKWTNKAFKKRTGLNQQSVIT